MEIVREVCKSHHCSAQKTIVECYHIIQFSFLLYHYQEMKLLAEVDQPGSMIENYVTQLSFVLSRKAAGLVSLQARLARFQHRLKEQEILSRKRVPR